ncbi:STAS domain-containing protein [Dactylosporangium sp. NPDC050588]|uniref:STAS domain-containing protein n=1 Tax=Dactylosporangium sp. NPDC050588 TaxID=3157211 RepID=UPI0034047374
MDGTVDPRTTSVVADDSAGPTAVTLHASGEFARDNCDLLATAFSAALAAGRRAITLDLRDVTFIDASTIRTLWIGRAAARDAGGAMLIVNAAGQVAWVLDLTATQHDHPAPDGGSPAPQPRTV